MGFTVCETLGHAESVDVAPDIVPRTDGDDKLGLEANDFEANDDKLDSESDCRVAHARQSSAVAPPSHTGVKAR